MTLQVVWQDLSLEDTLAYPYNVVININPREQDTYNRSEGRLLASLSCFGNRFLNGEISTEDLHITRPTFLQNFPQYTKIFTNETTHTEFYALTIYFPHFDTKSRKTISFHNLYNPDSLPDLTTLEQILFYHDIDHTNWVIFLVLISTTKKNVPTIQIKAYIIGSPTIAEVDRLALQLNEVLHRVFRAPKTTWRRRLQLPLTFSSDSVFLTYILVHYLQRHGNYLDLSTSKVTQHKIASFPIFIQCHDQWLGKLAIKEINKSSHPFLFLGDDYKANDNLSLIEQLGWYAVDVIGDGNCGYYSFILGLENLGNFSYSVTTPNTSDEPIPMEQNTSWQGKLISLRSSLLNHSNWLLNSQYPKGTREFDQDMWLLPGATDDDYVDGFEDCENEEEKIYGLSHGFINETFENQEYFLESFADKENSEYHMNPYWAPHVLASLLQIRVIVYQQNSYENPPVWSVVSCEYNSPTHTTDNPHVKVEWTVQLTDKESLEQHRPVDEEFKRVPTIELLLQYTGPNVGQHFQFLRRVVCSGVTEPQDESEEQIRDFLRRQQSTNTVTAASRNEPVRHKTLKKHAIAQKATELNQKSKVHNIPTKAIAKVPKEKASSREEPLHRECIADAMRSKKRKSVPRSISSKKAAKIQRWKDTRTLNEMYKNGTLPAMKLYFDQAEDKYYSCLWDANIGEEGGYTKKVLVTNIEECVPFLVEVANRRQNEWVGPPIGAPGDGQAPERLNTTIPTIYQQHGNPYCLTYSLASALFYCGFKNEGIVLAEQAPEFANLDFDQAIKELLLFMRNLVPLIGLPILYCTRTKGHTRVKRKMNWDDLFTEITPYPTIVIARTPNGATTHAFCVVDDLIFDSITPQALRLQMESVSWIFNGTDVVIHRALRFRTKISPEGCKVDGQYRRQVSKHW